LTQQVCFFKFNSIFKGEIEGTISKEVIALHPNILTPGSSLILQKFAIYIPSPVTRHIIVTKHNIVKFIANEQLSTPIRNWNWRINQPKVPIEISPQKQPQRKKKSNHVEDDIQQKEMELERREQELKKQEKEFEQEMKRSQKEKELKKKEEELKLKEEKIKSQREEELRRAEEKVKSQREEELKLKKKQEELKRREQELKEQKIKSQIEEELRIKQKQEELEKQQKFQQEEQEEDVEEPSSLRLITDDIELHDSVEFDEDF
jgi:hypothetical protein